MIDIPDRCTAAIFQGPGVPFSFESVSIPALGSREALVRIECTTICGSDIHTILGHRSEPTPTILGHESIGRVVAVGEPTPVDVHGQSLVPGDRVVWSPIIACFQCDRCHVGLTQKCRHLQKYGHLKLDQGHALSGGFAEYIVLRRGSSIAKLGSDWDARVFCPVSCATATVGCAIRKASPIADRSVLVFGAGMLGLTASAWCRSLGARRVTMVDLDEGRLERARSFGSDRLVLASNFGDAFANHTDEFDVVLEMSGSNPAAALAIEAAAIGGTVVFAGSASPIGTVPLNPEKVVRRCLTIVGVHNYTAADLIDAVNFLEAFGEQFPFASLTPDSFRFDQLANAVDHACSVKPPRVILQFP